MSMFSYHKMEQTKDGYNIILYLDKNMTEFATELGSNPKDKEHKLDNSVRNYIKQKLPNIKVHSAKIMLGSILVITIPLGGGKIYAAAETSSGQHDVSSTYVVQSNDTLSGISKRFGVTVDRLKQANHLTSDMIYVGQNLQLTQLDQPEKSTTYTVVSGDSLSVIAKRYSTTVEALKQINNLTGDTIHVGQTLRITGENKLPSGQEVTTYQVKPGDSLSVIAKQHGTTVDALIQINNLSGNTIYVGQQLTIPKQTTSPNIPQDEQKTNMLALGDTSAAVEQLQGNLQTLGYFKSSISSSFDSVTESAVRSFQKDYALTNDGVVGPGTQKEIEKALVKQRLIVDTDNYTGVPYRWGGDTPSGFDCSGFVSFMFKKHGVDISRTTSASLYQMGSTITRSSLQPGDLVFFGVNQPGVVSHVGFYVGNNNFVSATSSKGIWTYSMDNSYWSNYYLGAKRVY